MEWEVAAYRGEGDWQVLGRAEGSNPDAALRSWRGRHGAEHEIYGVRSPGAVAWEIFGFDDMGEPEAREVL